MKRILSATLMLSLFAGCAGSNNLMPVMNPNTQMGMRAPVTTFNAQNTVQNGDEEQTEGIVRNLFKESFADDVDNGRPHIEPQIPRGGFLFNRLNGGIPFRKLLYPISDRIIKKEFNKPGVPDNVPRIDAASLAKMQSLLQPGDIILCGNNDSFVHAIVYLGNDQIIHALAQLTKTGDFVGTIKETLTNYVSRSHRDKFVVLRKPGITPTDVKRMSDYAHAQLGKSYDSMFLLNTEDRLYCTEIVYHAIRQIGATPRVYAHKAKYGWDLFTVEDIMDSPDLQTVWTYNYTRPPVGRLHQYK